MSQDKEQNQPDPDEVVLNPGDLARFQECLAQDAEEARPQMEELDRKRVESLARAWEVFSR